MKTLFIDTHLNDITIILLENGEIRKKGEVLDKKNNSEVLFTTIINVIDNVELDEILVVNGPGSFTSVRLGVIIAKAMAYFLKIPIKTITSLEVMAISNNAYNVALSDLNGYYIGNFDENFKQKREFYYVNNSDFIDDNYVKDYQIDIKKVYNHVKKFSSINPHLVNPIYVKKIGVEIDKKS